MGQNKRAFLRLRALWPLCLAAGLMGQAEVERRPADVGERRAPNVEATEEVEKPAAPTVTPGACTPRALPFTGGKDQKIVRIDIHDTIDLGLAPFVERILEEAARDGTALVLLHMNTPGGRLDAAQTIKDALLKSKVPTATFIDTHALSAGALIAYATDFIIVTDGSTMGAATPINIGEKGEAQAVGEKFVSAVRAIFRSTAEAKKRDGDIAEAMVDKDMVVDGLSEKGKLLTLTAADLVKWCVADYQAPDIETLLQKLKLGGASVNHRELNWAERIARVLTDPMISGMLMSFGFLGIMLELYTAGFGVSGMIGIACLMLFFTGHMVVNLVGWEEMALFVAGAILLVVEVFVTPGFGLAGAGGLALLAASMALSMVGQDISFSWNIGVLPDALTRLGVSLVATVGIFAVAARFLPKTQMFGRLVLNSAVEGTSFDALVAAPESDGPVVRVGVSGVATTDIRGSGKARIAGHVIDVVSQGDCIDRGQRVVVVASRAGRIVVARAEVQA